MLRWEPNKPNFEPRENDLGGDVSCGFCEKVFRASTPIMLKTTDGFEVCGECAKTRGGGLLAEIIEGFNKHHLAKGLIHG